MMIRYLAVVLVATALVALVGLTRTDATVVKAALSRPAQNQLAASELENKVRALERRVMDDERLINANQRLRYGAVDMDARLHPYIAAVPTSAPTQMDSLDNYHVQLDHVDDYANPSMPYNYGDPIDANAIAGAPRAATVFQPVVSFVPDNKGWDASAVPVIATNVHGPVAPPYMSGLRASPRMFTGVREERQPGLQMFLQVDEAIAPATADELPNPFAFDSSLVETKSNAKAETKTQIKVKAAVGAKTVARSAYGFPDAPKAAAAETAPVSLLEIKETVGLKTQVEAKARATSHSDAELDAAVQAEVEAELRKELESIHAEANAMTDKIATVGTDAVLLQEQAKVLSQQQVQQQAYMEAKSREAMFQQPPGAVLRSQAVVDLADPLHNQKQLALGNSVFARKRLNLDPTALIDMQEHVQAVGSMVVTAPKGYDAHQNADSRKMAARISDIMRFTATNESVRTDATVQAKTKTATTATGKLAALSKAAVLAAAEAKQKAEDEKLAEREKTLAAAIAEVKPEANFLQLSEKDVSKDQALMTQQQKLNEMINAKMHASHVDLQKEAESLRFRKRASTSRAFQNKALRMRQTQTRPFNIVESVLGQKRFAVSPEMPGASNFVLKPQGYNFLEVAQDARKAATHAHGREEGSGMYPIPAEEMAQNNGYDTGMSPGSIQAQATRELFPGALQPNMRPSWNENESNSVNQRETERLVSGSVFGAMTGVMGLPQDQQEKPFITTKNPLPLAPNEKPLTDVVGNGEKMSFLQIPGAESPNFSQKVAAPGPETGYVTNLGPQPSQGLIRQQEIREARESMIPQYGSTMSQYRYFQGAVGQMNRYPMPLADQEQQRQPNFSDMTFQTMNVEDLNRASPVNPAADPSLQPVQFMSATPYFPSATASGDNHIPPAPQEQPVNPALLMAYAPQVQLGDAQAHPMAPPAQEGDGAPPPAM